jgi:S-DNA-T family DNA segregation ATPase FtsK/SpoIIIE
MASKKEGSSTHPEVRGLFLLSCCFLALLSLLSFHAGDRSANWLGLAGHGIAWGLSYLFGIATYLVLAFAGWMGWKLLVEGKVENSKIKTFYFSLLLISCCILLNLIAEIGMPIPGALKHKIITESVVLDLPYPHRPVRHNLGGVPLYYIYRDLPTLNLQRMLSDVGLGITFFLIGCVSFLALTEIPIVPLVRKLLARRPTLEKEPPVQLPEQLEKALSKPAFKPLYESEEKPEIRIRTLGEREEKAKPEPMTKRQAALSAQRVYNGDFTAYQLPPPSLLTSAKKVDQPQLKKELRRQAEILEETLMSFGIEAKVGDINCGPTITSFEVHPAVGVKVQKITALESDIALNLQAKSIRIIAPIPGKAAVGVEIPSPYPQEVSFKEMLLGYHQNPRKLHIPILLGKTVTGDNVISDLAKMPHCLIAGATGSGKSVCINTVVMSILMNARPDEIKLVMIDPKKVELTSYTKLPHLIAPVITEPHGAYAALNWLVKEMQIRYDILKQLGLRNIAAFNNRQINKEFESSLSVTVPERMHAIVAIIDEFADLMMASSSDLETPIARIAQMARAVGIHLILATQRPSREVITGLIKANFPTRIAFKVASRVNSQIILDENGADSLLGNGDMLFLPPGTSHLMRAQGAYISDEDINRVVNFICDQAPPHYLIPSFDAMPREENSEGDQDFSSRDSLYEQARFIVVETKTASTTFLQRKLKIGYARAASLMDELEATGVISSQEGAKPRRVLIEADEMGGHGSSPD